MPGCDDLEAMGTPEPVDHPLHGRLARILERAAGRAAQIDSYGRPVAPAGAADVIGANSYLQVMRDSPEVELAVYPADTLGQAKAFYTRHNAHAGVRQLRSHAGWHARPNFHFGHFQRGYCWTCNERALEEYIQLWVRRIGGETAVPRKDRERYWAWLQAERIACPRDRADFDRYLVRSNRPHAVLRPGLALSRRWPLQEAEALDREDGLRRQVRQALDDALAAFGGRAVDRG
jgi:hypothetical protein